MFFNTLTERLELGAVLFIDAGQACLCYQSSGHGDFDGESNSGVTLVVPEGQGGSG
jgi:hypothetical protein